MKKLLFSINTSRTKNLSAAFKKKKQKLDFALSLDYMFKAFSQLHCVALVFKPIMYIALCSLELTLVLMSVVIYHLPLTMILVMKIYWC